MAPGANKNCSVYIDKMDIRARYPDRVPIVMHKTDKSSQDVEIGELDKKKYLVPHTMQLGEFLAIIRRKLHLSASIALFVFIESSGICPTVTDNMKDLYDRHAVNGKLHLTYSGESAFGNTAVL